MCVCVLQKVQVLSSRLSDVVNCNTLAPGGAIYIQITILSLSFPMFEPPKPVRRGVVFYGERTTEANATGVGAHSSHCQAVVWPDRVLIKPLRVIGFSPGSEWW